MASSELHKRRFVDQTFDLLSGALGASRLVFYSVDEASNLYDFVGYRVPSEFIRLYVREMHEIDPLHVRCVEATGERVVRMDDAARYAPAYALRDYKTYLSHFAVRNSIDLLFRKHDRVRAGVSVMWADDDEPPSERRYALAETLQDYIQFTIDDHLSEGSADPLDRAIRVLHLTRREGEVSKLLCYGRTNADIAGCLGISLATVKTHLIHVFEKAGVENRSALVARVMALV